MRLPVDDHEQFAWLESYASWYFSAVLNRNFPTPKPQRGEPAEAVAGGRWGEKPVKP